jgi:AraC-like DNA-binding protein
MVSRADGRVVVDRSGLRRRRGQDESNLRRVDRRLRTGQGLHEPNRTGAPESPMQFTPPAPTAALRLMPMQALAQGGKWRTEAMRSYRMPLLLWFTRGQGRITVAGVTRGYGAHNAIFLPARTMHGFEITAQVFGTAAFFAEGAGLALPKSPLHLRIRDVLIQGEMTTILEQLQRELDGTRPFRERAVLHHAGLLTVWLDRQAAAAEDQAVPKAALRLARSFTRMVEDQLYTGQTVADYAEALGVTPTHLIRVCRETCGRPASDIIADRVTFEARRLLADTSLPVRRVAEVLGFRSAAYFTRAFQSRTGQTPTAFRAAARA